MKKSRQNIIFAVIFSVAIHIVIGIILFHNLSANFTFSESFPKLNLVWVALETKSNPGIVAANRRPVADSRRNYPERVAIANTSERPEMEKVVREVEKAAAPGWAGEVILSGHNSTVGQAAQEQVDNLQGSAADEAAGSRVMPVNASYPLYRENVPPVYPQIARIRGYEGAVLISTEILPGGDVGNLRIKKSSGYAVLDQAAMEAVKNWKFEPAKKMGKPYATWRDHLIKFFLNEDNSQS